jgi:hypothetical protein
MVDGDLHEQILRLEVHIEELAEATDRCRKIIVMSKAAMAVGGILILAITVQAISSCCYHRGDYIHYRRHRRFRVE